MKYGVNEVVFLRGCFIVKLFFSKFDYKVDQRKYLEYTCYKIEVRFESL